MKQDHLTIPEGYFEKLPDIIQSKIFLDGLNKENAFEVPEGYFDELPALIQNRILSENKETKIISIFRNKLSYVAAAASIALIIGLGLFFNKSANTLSETKAVAMTEHKNALTKDDIKEYLRENVDEATIMEYAFTGNMNANIEVKTDNLDKKDMINYILENNIDVNEI